MEPDDDLSRRPQSPKKKVKADTSLDSEAQPSESSRSNSNAHRNDENDYSRMNGGGIAPTRKSRLPVRASLADSSSERSTTARISPDISDVIQEGEVSSSENTVPRVRQTSQESSGNADSNCKDNDDQIIVCDSASPETSNFP